MKIEIQKGTQNKWKVGDLIQYDGGSDIYILRRNSPVGKASYVLSSFCGSFWSNGEHESIESLQRDLESTNLRFTHYSKDDFKLVLQPKN